MKKFLLSFLLAASVGVAQAQIYLNELFVRPQTTGNEWFELYNAGLTPASAGCYSLVTYFNDGTNMGFYVVDIPNITIPAQGYLVGSSQDPFIDYQGNTVQADFSWNDGNIYRYIWVNGSLVLDNTGAPYNDIFVKSSATGASNGVFATFLFNGSTLVDAFLGAHNNTTVPNYITLLGTLTHTSTQQACGNLTYNFNNINNEPNNLFANVNASAGVDHGYYREGDGPCPFNQNWVKASSPAEFTPGTHNPFAGGIGNQPPPVYTINASCTNATTLVYSISTTFNISAAVNVRLYNDVNANAKLDAVDAQIGAQQSYTINSGLQSFTKPAGPEYFLLVIDAPGICFDKIVSVQCPAGIILPVRLQSFTARRNRAAVSLAWETVNELNNQGFDIQRKTGTGNWESVAFIRSQAPGGSSSTLLRYSFTDQNSTRGITQYRLRQVDLDGKSVYSEIRSVKGEGQLSGITVYPNPSRDGKVNLMFDDQNGVRDVVVSDLSGRVVKQWTNISNNNLLIENLQAGFYNIRITNRTTGEQAVEKIVVNK